MKTKIAVLVSGGGTNLQALLDAQKSGVLCSGEIALVVSNNAGAFALERAKNAGVPTAVLLKKELGGQAGFEKALGETLKEHGIQRDPGRGRDHRTKERGYPARRYP